MIATNSNDFDVKLVDAFESSAIKTTNENN